MSQWDLHASDPRALGRVMGLGGTGERIWRPEELATLLRHQLSASIQFDLGNLDAGMAARLKALGAGENLLLNSFNDLLHHPHPPIELLMMTKDFARAIQNHPDSPLPREIALLLYFASIVVALVRCGRRITSFDDKTLRRSLEWFENQPWVEESMRSLLGEGLRWLDAHETLFAPGQ